MRQTPKSRHTPGPWHIINEKTIVGADSPRQGYVADVNLHRSSDNGEPDGFANAVLIAAAPAMYEALAKLRLEAIHYRNTGVGVQFLNAALDQAEDAINLVYGVTK